MTGIIPEDARPLPSTVLILTREIVQRTKSKAENAFPLHDDDGSLTSDFLLLLVVNH